MSKIAAALSFTAAVLSAQNINKFVISDEAAKKTLIKNEISADTAAKITQACVDFAVKNNIAVSIFILSPTGQIVACPPHGRSSSDQYRNGLDEGSKRAVYTRFESHSGQSGGQ